MGCKFSSISRPHWLPTYGAHNPQGTPELAFVVFVVPVVSESVVAWSMLGRCPLASSLLSLLRADSARGTAKADVPARPPGPTPDFLRERSVGIAGKGGGAVQIALGKERPGSPAPLPVVTGIDAREILLTCPRPLPYIFLPMCPPRPPETPCPSPALPSLPHPP